MLPDTRTPTPASDRRRSADPFARLDPSQREAVDHDLEALNSGRPPSPLLILAGAGTGKTETLTGRAARLLVEGADPSRIILLTFTRKAAREMTRRAGAAASRAGAPSTDLPWSGTFHAVAARLLRMYGEAGGLSPDFTIMDAGDAKDLMEIVRADAGIGRDDAGFPRKGTVHAIYSYAVNACRPLDDVLPNRFPRHAGRDDGLRRLFRAYADAKEARGVLDYDDLLLHLALLLEDPDAGEPIRRAFDHVLVDEFQDTNALQASILKGLRPDGTGLAAVGDDAQSIYSFRAARVANVRDFREGFPNPVRVVTLEANRRSVQPVLDLANAVIAPSAEVHPKNLHAIRDGGTRPRLVRAADARDEARNVVDDVVSAHDAGTPLAEQALLVRSARDAAEAEIELTRRGVPFRKQGGPRFVDAAHVKDAVAALRIAENPNDRVAAVRLLTLLPGVGHATASRAANAVESAGDAATGLRATSPPKSAAAEWDHLVDLMDGLCRRAAWPDQTAMVRAWYARHAERLHDDADQRLEDLVTLESLAAGHHARRDFLNEIALDPPQSAAEAGSGPPDDAVVVSTVHSAKGQEYTRVAVLNAVDGRFPIAAAGEAVDALEEERRLLYVALTRAKDDLDVILRLRRDNGSLARPSRFLPDDGSGLFGTIATDAAGALDAPAGRKDARRRIDVRRRARRAW